MQKIDLTTRRVLAAPWEHRNKQEFATVGIKINLANLEIVANTTIHCHQQHHQQQQQPLPPLQQRRPHLH